MIGEWYCWFGLWTVGWKNALREVKKLKISMFKWGSSRLLCTVNYVGIAVVVFDPANMTKRGRNKTNELFQLMIWKRKNVGRKRKSSGGGKLSLGGLEQEEEQDWRKRWFGNVTNGRTVRSRGKRSYLRFADERKWWNDEEQTDRGEWWEKSSNEVQILVFCYRIAKIEKTRRKKRLPGPSPNLSEPILGAALLNRALLYLSEPNYQHEPSSLYPSPLQPHVRAHLSPFASLPIKDRHPSPFWTRRLLYPSPIRSPLWTRDFFAEPTSPRCPSP